jgi:hypothetical protein
MAKAGSLANRRQRARPSANKSHGSRMIMGQNDDEKEIGKIMRRSDEVLGMIRRAISPRRGSGT